MEEVQQRAMALIRAVDVTDRRPVERSHPDMGCALWQTDPYPDARLTRIYAGQGLCGAPRRNRTGDPILTMDVLCRLS
jgi:hypothetical protein